MFGEYYPNRLLDGTIIAKTFPVLSLIESKIDVDPGTVERPIKLHALLIIAIYEEWIHGGNTNLGFTRARLLAHEVNYNLLESYRDASTDRTRTRIKSDIVHNAIVAKKLHRKSIEIVELSDKFIHQSLTRDNGFTKSVINHTGSLFLNQDGSIPPWEYRQQLVQKLLGQSQERVQRDDPELYDRLVRLREETGSIIFVKLVIDCALDIPHPPKLASVSDAYRTSLQMREIDFRRRLQLLLDELERRPELSDHPAIIDARHHEDQNLQLGYAPPSSLEDRLTWYIYHEIARVAGVTTPLLERRPALHTTPFPLIEVPHTQSQAAFLNKVDYRGAHLDDDSVVKSDEMTAHHPDSKPSNEAVLFDFGFVQLFSVVAAIAFPNKGEDVLYLNPDIKDRELSNHGGLSYEQVWKRWFVSRQLLDDLLRYSTGAKGVEFTCPICRNFDLVYPEERLFDHRDFHGLASELRSTCEQFRALKVDREDELAELLNSEEEVPD